MMETLLAFFPQRALRSSDLALRSGKRLRCGLPLLGQAQNPQKLRQPERPLQLLELPNELVEAILLDNPAITPQELCNLARVCKKTREITGNDNKWRQEFVKRWAFSKEEMFLIEEAAKLAGGWKQLYRSKLETDTAAAPWQRPSLFEQNALLRRIASGATVRAEGKPPSGLAVVFLLDGSGSVTSEDFTTMTRFVSEAVTTICETQSDCKVGVVQFSNDVRVELAPQPVDKDSFHTLMDSMTRMNGGTNIAVSIQKAGQLLKNLEGDIARVVVMLTDGRVDSYQAREAEEMTERLYDEQANVSVYAYGVGRGVDKAELVRIIGAAGRETAESRYMGLRVLDEAPW